MSRTKLLVAIVTAVALSTAVVMLKGRFSSRLSSRAVTTVQFTHIALALRSYADNVALYEYQSTHAPNGQGIPMEDVAWEHGRLPFPVRHRADASDIRSFYLENGNGEESWSWRVELLPYLESMHADLNPSEPWHSKNNRHVLQRYGAYFSYCLPDDVRDNPDLFPQANALAITGPDTAWGCETEPPRRLKEIPNDTILVVEVRSSGIPWPAPGDLDIRNMPQAVNDPEGKGVSSKYTDGFHVVFADGQVWFLSNQVPFVELRKFFTISGARTHDRDTLLKPYLIDYAPHDTDR